LRLKEITYSSCSGVPQDAQLPGYDLQILEQQANSRLTDKGDATTSTRSLIGFTTALSAFSWFS
jgi:hypothetical protein